MTFWVISKVYEIDQLIFKMNVQVLLSISANDAVKIQSENTRNQFFSPRVQYRLG